jgi:putative transposase
MRPSRFTETQIKQALQDVVAGSPAVAVCRRLGITQTTFYRWRKQFGAPQISDANELQELRAENKRLRAVVANFLLDKMPFSLPHSIA